MIQLTIVYHYVSHVSPFPIINNVSYFQAPWTTPQEDSTADYMALIASQYDADMVWGMGDNIYEAGVVNEYDPRFNETFEAIFGAYSSLKDIPYYMIAGNHDHYGNITGQIFYSNHSTRWIYPDSYYSKTFQIPNSEKSVELIMIDTIDACGDNYDSLEHCKSLNVPKERCFVEQPGFDKSDKEKYKQQLSVSIGQWEWIENKLNESTADYLFVAGHYPVWNIGKHQNTDCLIAQLRPLLIEYDVTMYLNGHSHTAECIIEDDYPKLPYITQGAAHGCDDTTYNDTVPAEWVKYHDCKYGGFSRLHINDTGAFVEFYYGNSTEVQFVSPVISSRKV